ncbi:ribonuclease P protein component [Nocardia stercoris]|uniref:Ribonuclease P protein component n=1 Tax=Nocardia stercoris TaxID=2483361 RepID=A0A3M2L8Z5_9NOCA|nr:ribonuclease P protein component [Nocardia stercoris]RMI34101.1 ribonuclease P protein component [Nocardia stercoris]
MLPEPYRLHHRADFSRTVRRGRRIGRRDLVVHALVWPTGPDEHTGEPFVRSGGPRFGLIVSKAVGSAVVRHRVARRLRHMCGALRDELPAETDIVIRALPGAADTPTAELDRQLRAALHKLLRAPAERVRTGTPVPTADGAP